ncbi:ShlB/FhaC/HecB family hemolysin secretion/activation protein [Massilia sp. UYP11]|uniref:ShlB/FhaC/HecB family hemolysin secretion/activation protein n=1 Tax=Massilia sp. UYP11 TaxID=1756385 RepID=UPI003D1F97B5
MPLKAAPDVRIEAGNALPAAPSDSVKIVVNRVRVAGAQAYPEPKLLALTGFVPGSELSMADLLRMAARLVAHYRRDGYLLAQAYLPAQDIKDGVVTIAVLEGHYGKISFRNQSNMSDRLLASQIDGLHAGDAVTNGPLESGLLLLSDLPGVVVTSTLAPGASVGSADLIVDVVPGRRVSGSVDADNAGNRYTGQYRLGATVNVNQVLGLGDVATVRMISSGEGLNYARASYQMHFGKVQAGLGYSKLRYKLGKEFAPLHAHGTAEVASIFASYPLIRSRNANLSTQIAYDARSFHDEVDLTGALSDKKTDVLMASLLGDRRDKFGGGGANAFSLTWSSGELDIRTPGVLAIDAATARSNGSFNKLSYSASRVQRITDAVSLSAAINGQFASKNLDVSEKMELGGMNAVRAYPEGEAYADQGFVLSLEARALLPKLSAQQPGQLHLVGFVDTGRVTSERTPWLAGPNSRTLSGAGLGLVWADSNDFMVRAYYARKLGSETATSAPDKSGRFWLQAVKFF